MPSDIDAEFQRIRAKLARDGFYDTTPRHLLNLLGVSRRGVHVIAEIRSRLAKHNLEAPDFAEVDVDESVEFLSKTDESPGIEHLREAARRLESSEPPLQVSVRELIHWFGWKKRGARVCGEIRASLAAFELATEPDFESAHISSDVLLVPSDSGQPLDAPSAVTPRVEDVAGSTFHVGTLIEANRPVYSIPPQSSLSKVSSLMVTHRVSHVPVMKNAKALIGVVRWKDIGKYLALSDGTLEAPVETLLVPAKEVSTNAPFLLVVPTVLQSGCVFVRDSKQEITGVLTKGDVARILQGLASPFVTIGEIEFRLRSLLERGNFTPKELSKATKASSCERQIDSLADMTLGECQRLLENRETWQRVGLRVDRVTFVNGLEQVRMIRNRVMHFEPDNLDTDDQEVLRKFLELVTDLGLHSGQ